MKKQAILAASLAAALLAGTAQASYGYGVVPGVGEFIRKMQQDAEPAPVTYAQADIAQAQVPPTTREYCELLADHAEAAAIDRDNGVSFVQSRDHLISEIEDLKYRIEAIYAVQVVYAEPHESPATEAENVSRWCWDTYGEEF